MKTVYNFEFEVTGTITVGEFEVTFLAEYADGVFEANVTMSTPIIVMVGRCWLTR